MTVPALICPACSKPKTKRAQLCADCRRRAVSIGVKSLLEVAERGHGPAIELINSRQISAFYGKAAELDRILDRPFRTGHNLALAKASAEFNRRIESVKDLSYEEASWILDELSAEVAATKAALVEA
jgi:hypothetical protein